MNALEPQKLMQFSIFKGLSENQFKKIGEIIIQQNYSKGEQIIEEGEKGEELFLLFEGEVEVSKSLTLSTGGGTLDTMDKSLVRMKADMAPFFGEMAILYEGSRRSASVRVIQSCVVGIIKRKALLDLCKKDAEIGYRLMNNIATILAKRLEKADQDIMKLTTAFSLALQE